MARKGYYERCPECGRVLGYDEILECEECGKFLVDDADYEKTLDDLVDLFDGTRDFDIDGDWWAS